MVNSGCFADGRALQLRIKHVLGLGSGKLGVALALQARFWELVHCLGGEESHSFPPGLS